MAQRLSAKSLGRQDFTDRLPLSSAQTSFPLPPRHSLLSSFQNGIMAERREREHFSRPKEALRRVSASACLLGGAFDALRKGFDGLYPHCGAPTCLKGLPLYMLSIAPGFLAFYDVVVSENRNASKDHCAVNPARLLKYCIASLIPNLNDLFLALALDLYQNHQNNVLHSPFFAQPK